jgi:hypothetical protein
MDRRDFFRHTISTGETRRGGIGRLSVAAKRRLSNVDMHDVDQLFEQERVLGISRRPDKRKRDH